MIRCGASLPESCRNGTAKGSETPCASPGFRRRRDRCTAEERNRTAAIPAAPSPRPSLSQLQPAADKDRVGRKTGAVAIVVAGGGASSLGIPPFCPRRWVRECRARRRREKRRKRNVERKQKRGEDYYIGNGGRGW